MLAQLIFMDIRDEIDLSFHAGSSDLYADVNRTDSYVADGTPDRPFKDLTDAVALANLMALEAKPYRVNVAPGIYDLPPFALNAYVKLEGAGWQTTILKASTLTEHFITMAPGTVIRDVAVWGPTTANTAAIHAPTAGAKAVGLIQVSISRGYYGVLCNPVAPGQMLIQNLILADVGESIHTLVRAEDHATVFVVSSVVAGSAESVQCGVAAVGADASCTLVNYYHQVPGAATEGAFVDDGAMVRVVGGIFAAGHAALHAGSGASSRIRVDSAIVHRDLGPSTGYTHDLLIESATVTTTFMGFMSRDRISNAFNASIFGNFINHEDGFEGACALGELVVGDDREVLPLLDYGKSAYLTGLVSGGEVELGAGLNVIVRAGYGYINDPALCSPIRVPWLEDLHFALTDDTPDQYIYVDNTGTICKSTLSIDYGTNIILAKATTEGGAVVVLTRDEISIVHTTSRLADFFEHVIGPLTASGCNVTATGGNTYKIDVNGGTFLVGLSERDITGAAGTPFTYVWQTAPGVWTYTAATIIDKDHYDNGTGPTDFGGDDWKKDVVYLVKNSGGEQYFVVMGQTAFADQATALSGALPTAPDLLMAYGLRVAAIVTHSSAADIDTVVDIRPFLGQNAPVSTSVAVNHDDLANRNLDNNHTQYHTDARAVVWLAAQPGNTSNLVTDGDNHNHDGVTGGAQVAHGDLGARGTTTHADLDLFVGSKAAASGLASLDGSSKVVQNPANATATATAGKIPIADGAGTLNDWVPANAAAATPSRRKLGIGATDACAGDDARLSDPRTPTSTLAHKASHVSGADQIDDATALAHGLMTAAQFSKLAGIEAGANLNRYGAERAYAESTGRTTYNTNTTFQDKVSLATGVLANGVKYKVMWEAVIDQSATNQNCGIQLYNSTDAVVVGAERVYRVNNSGERRTVGGSAQITGAGALKTFVIQYKTYNTGSTVGIQDARIEVIRAE